MNILILSCGIRNQLVRYFKKALRDQGAVVTADCSKYAPALYEGDYHHVIPKFGESGYLETVLDICRRQQIRGVISLVDPELSQIARHRGQFIKIGATPIVSDEYIVELCLDKYRMSEFLGEHGFGLINSYTDKESFFTALNKGQVGYPVIVKPTKGSASTDVDTAVSDEEVNLLFDRRSGMMIQQRINGTEFGIDAYVDILSGDLVALFAKKKLKMRAGETDISVSVKNQRITDLITRLTSTLDLRGVIDVDIIRAGNEYYVLEINPRFGGGYPHAYACGVDIPKMIINNLKRIKNLQTVNNQQAGVVMMKFIDVLIMNGIDG